MPRSHWCWKYKHDSLRQDKLLVDPLQPLLSTLLLKETKNRRINCPQFQLRTAGENPGLSAQCPPGGARGRRGPGQGARARPAQPSSCAAPPGSLRCGQHRAQAACSALPGSLVSAPQIPVLTPFPVIVYALSFPVPSSPFQFPHSSCRTSSLPFSTTFPQPQVSSASP